MPVANAVVFDPSPVSSGTGPPLTTPSITYDGTNININVPAGGGVKTQVGGATVSTVGGGSGTPTGSTGATLGSGGSPGTAIVGDDSRGKITMTAGSTPGSAGVASTVTFGQAYSVAPASVTLTPANANAANVSGTNGVQPYVSSITTTTFVITFVVAPQASQAYAYYYDVID